MSKLGDMFRAVGRALKRTVNATREKVAQTFNALRQGRSVGELEQRFSLTRPLGGFRLQRTGKHRGTKNGCLGPRQREGLPGSKLWRKAAEHSL